MISSLLIWTLCVFGQAPAAADSVRGFTVGGLITHYRPDKPLYLALYDSEDALANRRFCNKLRFMPDKLPSDSLRYEFRGVAPGEYVIAAFQDLNGDVKMNIGIFGPTEPYRIYRNHVGYFGPKFDACKFRVTGDMRNADMRF